MAGICAVTVALIMSSHAEPVMADLSLLDACPVVKPVACAFVHMGNYQDTMHIVCFANQEEVYKGRAVKLRGI